MTSAQKQLSSGDSSEPLFDLYSKLAKDEDDEMTEHWKHEATDGVLIFVSHHVHHSCYYAIHLNAIDRSILCCCRRAAHRVRPGPPSQARISGHLRILSREHLSGSRCSKCDSTTPIHPVHSCYTTPVFSTEICHLGEFTLVLELSDQLYMCSLGNDAASMGISIHQAHSASTTPPRGASSNARIFC
jgi:hypothetical protein